MRVIILEEMLLEFSGFLFYGQNFNQILIPFVNLLVFAQLEPKYQFNTISFMIFYTCSSENLLINYSNLNIFKYQAEKFYIYNLLNNCKLF